MADMIQIRRDTAANWTSANPILAQGELGAETDTSKIKIGDGTTVWASLSYLIDTSSYLTAAAIGSTVQAFDATIVVDADIGVSVQAYDATIVVDADIGVSVQAYDATIVVDADIGSTVQAYDADTTKNDVANTFTAVQTFGKSVVETRVAIAAAEIDLALGNYFTKSSVGTLTLTLTNEAATGSVSAFVLELANGASPAVTFTFNAGSTVTWAAATAPTLTASGTDVLAFFTYDGGTTWRGFVLGLGMA
tara:strand:+ start:1457 stop:2206 length:750 start_codon:yes stop_codon:yes gene_type:complete